MRTMALRLDDLWRDLRLAARGLWRSRRFTAAVVLTLAIGTGATTALFSVVDAVLIRPLPYPDSDRIVSIRGNGPQAFILFGGPRHFQLLVPELANGAIQHVGVYQVGGMNLGVAPAIRLRAAAVSPAFFEVMGSTRREGERSQKATWDDLPRSPC
jgi:putative ABC transport system permease protein